MSALPQSAIRDFIRKPPALAVLGILVAGSKLLLPPFSHILPTTLLSALSDVGLTLIIVVSAWQAARRSTHLARTVWVCVAVASAFWTLSGGVGVLALAAQGIREALSAFWRSTIIFYLVGIALALPLLLREDRETPGIEWLRAFDLAQLGIVTFCAYLVLFYIPMVTGSSDTSRVQSFMALHWLRDGFLALGYLYRGWRSRVPALRRLQIRLACFFVAFACSGSFSAYFFVRGLPWQIPLVELAADLPVIFLLLLAATWRQPPEIALASREPRTSQELLWAQLMPVILPVSVIVLSSRITPQYLRLAWTAVAASVVCYAGRLVLTNQQERRIADDLRRTQQALRSSEHMFSSAFRASPDAISISLLPDGLVQEINDSFVRLTGFSRQDVLGKSPENIGLWMDEEHMRALRAHFRETGELREADFRFRRKDGAIRYGLLSGTRIELDGRSYSLVVVRDVTESKQAEDALRASEERFRTLVRDLQVGVALVRPNGQIQFANPAALELFGLRESEPLGKTVANLGMVSLYEDGTEMPLDARPVARAIQTRQPVRATVMGWQLGNPPRVVWIIGNAIPQLNSNGEVESVITSFADITALRKTQEALQSSEQRFRSLVQIVRVGISTWGPDGRLQFVNQALLEMFGPPPTEIIGKTSPEIIPAIREDGTEIPPEMRPAARVIATRLPVRNQVIGWTLPSSGRIVWTLVDAVPEFTADGQLARVTASLADITDLRRAQEEKRVSEEMFSKAFHSSPDSMTISTLNESRYLEVNEGFTRLFGWRRDEVIGKTIEELGFWPNLADHKQLKTKLLNSGRASQLEFSLRVKSGELRTVQISADLISLNGQTCVLSLAHDITDRKRQEAELRASEQRSRTLLEAMRVGVSTWGPDGRCRSANWALQEMTGMTEDQFIGKTGAELGPAYDEDGKEVPGPLRPAARAKATRAPVRKQVLGLKTPSREDLLWVLADAVPEFTPDGEFQGLIASYTDITDLKRAQEQTRISQEMFSKAFHSSPDAVTISTVEDGRYVEVNEGYTRLFGWRRDEAVGKTVLELGVWPDPAGREAFKRALRQHGQIRQMELHLRTKSGQLRTFLISADVIELNGEVCLLAVCDDITEWKAAQEALRFSEERFRTLVQSLDAGVALLGADARIQFANRAALRMVRLELDQVLGKRVGDLGLSLVREDGSPLVESDRPAPKVLETGQPVRNMVIGFQRPGTEELLWAFSNVAPLFAEDGRIAGVVASFADITEQKKSSEALRQLSGRLLQLQDEERRRLGRDLHDSLAQSVLAVNLSLAQVTQSSNTLDDRAKRTLGDARVLLQDMSRQIRSLSYLLHPPLLDELGLVSAVKEYALGFSERSGIQIQVGVSPGFGRLPQEAETALFRIIQESLANIQRHSGSPSARIRLSGTPSTITLEISDQGHGMSAASGKKLNKPGARIGVGIAGMRERMAQLGGTLEIDSGKSGTTVRATLPVKAEVLDVASRSRSG